MFLQTTRNLLILLITLKLCYFEINLAAQFDSANLTQWKSVSKSTDESEINDSIYTEVYIDNSYLLKEGETEPDDYYQYEYSDRVLYLYSIHNNCFLILSPILLVIGTFGNCLSIAVLCR